MTAMFPELSKSGLLCALPDMCTDTAVLAGGLVFLKQSHPDFLTLYSDDSFLEYW